MQDPSIVAIVAIRIAGVVGVVFFAIAAKVKRNRWAGIRLPYTLADDEVWRKVHLRFRWALLGLGLAGSLSRRS